MECIQEAIIPGLPYDLALRCLAKLSHGYHGVLESVSKSWKDLVRSDGYANYKAKEGWCGDWLFVVTECSNNQWIAHDREANKWHPLPKIPTDHDGLQHIGFSSFCVCNRLPVIGGSHAPRDTAFPPEMPETEITNDLLQFDPFKKQWTRVKSMQTQRSYFAYYVREGLCCWRQHLTPTGFLLQRFMIQQVIAKLHFFKDDMFSFSQKHHGR